MAATISIEAFADFLEVRGISIDDYTGFDGATKLGWYQVYEQQQQSASTCPNSCTLLFFYYYRSTYGSSI